VTWNKCGILEQHLELVDVAKALHKSPILGLQARQMAIVDAIIKRPFAVNLGI
jgi:hypothetical protein